MSFVLNEDEHEKLSVLADGILHAFKQGEVTMEQAREAIAHVVAAAAQDNAGEVRGWLEPDRLKHWKDLCKAHRI